MDIYLVRSNKYSQAPGAHGYHGSRGTGMPSTAGVPNKFGYAVLLFTLVMIVYIAYRIRKGKKES
jgi:hypothetical protein